MDNSNLKDLEFDEPEEIFEVIEDSQEKNINTLQILSWKKRYKSVPIPSMIINDSLKVIWHNIAFGKYFQSQTNDYSAHITDFFNNLKDVKKLKEIYNSLNINATGYTWQGRVTSRNKKS
jgi:c-di-AMP phosphodiesterase-like protein